MEFVSSLMNSVFFEFFFEETSKIFETCSDGCQVCFFLKVLSNCPAGYSGILPQAVYISDDPEWKTRFPK